MSSRAFRRLQRDADVIQLRGEAGSSEEEGAEEPGLAGGASKTANLFSMLLEDGEEGERSSEEVDEQPSAMPKPQPTSKKQRKKKKKKNKQQNSPAIEDGVKGDEDVDAAIKEVKELLGEDNDIMMTSSPAGGHTPQRALLAVDRRFLNADSEMRRIFGARVVRGEEQHRRRRDHRRNYHRPTILATPRDTWPRMDRPGVTMEMEEGSRDGCQYFVFEHSNDYQKIQFRFWEAVETFDPNAITAVLHAHPYHIDSLLQLSEVCKMSEDLQMAAELIERALYCFECSFHTMFNVSQGTCRLHYSRAENRPFFLALFRHICYIGRKGCHRTALELCKLLLALDPSGDPLCALLLIDYHAVRAGAWHFLIQLQQHWEDQKNLSQLPNFAFSVPLAMFHQSLSREASRGEGEEGEEREERKEEEEAGRLLQDALISFPSLLLPLLEKCSVTMDPVVMKHPHFSQDMARDPKALQILLNLYIERAHSLWKEPEVLTWLEANARLALRRVDASDPLLSSSAVQRQKRYVGTPRNIYRHAIISDFDRVVATLPPELTRRAIMMYDPLPPDDSTSGYARPQRVRPALRGNETPLMLFLRSLLPTFNIEGEGGDGVRRVRVEGLPRQGGEDGGGGGGAEGGRPLNLQPMLDRLTESIQGLFRDLQPQDQSDSSGEDEH